MITLQEAFYQLKNALVAHYDVGEATAISHELLNHFTGLSKFDRLLHKDQLLTQHQWQLYTDAQTRLMQGEPLQYITGIGWFMGEAFEVNKQVLIPRPETEELVHWMVQEQKENPSLRLLDIGTGSGCIPISIKTMLPSSHVTSCDISAEAILVAARNAEKMGVEVCFKIVDFLEERNWDDFEQYNVIVSNPPYIPLKEKQLLHTNVVDYEPALALFVPDNDPLLFYRKIARFAQAHLAPDGAVYFEVHQSMAGDTQKMLLDFFEVVALQKDMSGNDRMIKATKARRL